MTDPRQTLAPLVGEWSLAMVMPGDERPDPLPDVGARTSWEWLGDSGLLLQRWSIPFEGAPDGLAVIGWNEERSTFLQHYFDDRTVVRVYELRLEGGELTMERTQVDFSPLHFSQRYVGAVTEDRIDGAWYMAEDHRTWAKDFDLIYTRLDQDESAEDDRATKMVGDFFGGVRRAGRVVAPESPAAAGSND